MAYQSLGKIELSDIHNKLVAHIQKTWAEESGRSAQETATALLSFERANYQMDVIKKYISVKGKKLLEIGSGYAVFLSLARKKYGVLAYGIEPADWGLYTNTFEIGKQVLRRMGVSSRYLLKGHGENTFLPNESFDIVYSHYVLEHVNSEKNIIREAVRILKTGGLLIFIVPNYHSFWEGHYGIPWLPFLNKKLAKIYVRLWGRNPSIIDELNFVNQNVLKNILQGFPEMTVVTWGEDLFREALISLDFPDGGTMSSAKKILKFIKILGLSKFVFFLAKTFNLYTPIVLVGRKTNNHKINQAHRI